MADRPPLSPPERPFEVWRYLGCSHKVESIPTQERRLCVFNLTAKRKVESPSTQTARATFLTTRGTRGPSGGQIT